MKKMLFFAALLLYCSFLSAEDKPLDASVFDTWKTIEHFTVSDDGSWTFTQYKNKKDGISLDINIRAKSIKKSIKGGDSYEFFNNQQSATFMVKDTLFIISKINGEINKIGCVKSFSADEKSPYLSYIKGNVLFIMNTHNNRCDSITSVINSHFVSPKMLVVIAKRADATILMAVGIKKENMLDSNVIYNNKRVVTDFSANKNGSKIVFFSSKDSLAVEGVETVVAHVNGKDLKILQLSEKCVPAGMKFNVKKGISFSKNENYLKFEITKIKKEEKAKKAKVKKAAFEYELWRWNDTLLPVSKPKSEALTSNLKCIYYPETNKFIQLANGKGVFLLQDDNAPFGFEINDIKYQKEALWKYPVPKDVSCVNVKTGEKKDVLTEFNGTFSFLPDASQIITYDAKTGAWFITDLNTLVAVNLSSNMPYPVQDQDFDMPRPVESYGNAGLTADGKYLLVNDQFDIWALPVTGKGNPICITNGYGRKNNIKFKIMKSDDKDSEPQRVDLKSAILLTSVNMSNRHSGFYMLEKGKDPQKIIEGPYQYSFVKQIGKDNYIIKRESFNESPDYWLTDKNFKPLERLTDLNDQHKGYLFGNSKMISWKDDAGREQKGVLCTPVNYDSTKSYPAIVLFYETKTQETYMFHQPAPTTGEMNPVMFVSRGYVVFMPDIHYEIGWPGKSCVNAVVSGTKYLIAKGIIDPKRVGCEGHSWGGYQVAFLITQTNIFTCACSETAVANMTSAYSGIRSGAGKPRMFMYESHQSRIGGTLWEKPENYIKNSPLFYLDHVTTPLLSRHSDDDEAVPYSQGLELFLGMKRLGKQMWMFNYKGDGHNIRKREIALDWSKRMDEYFDFYLMGKKKPEWM